VDAVLTDFVARVRARLGDELVRVSLFGSRARGTARPGSDYDLLVVVSGDRAQAREAVSWVDLDLLLERAANLSPKVVTRQQLEELRRSGEPFWRNFERDEVVLWPTPHSPPR
jgi:predicted nucleotidyltransferase